MLNPQVVWPTRQDPHTPKPEVWQEERFLPLAQDMPPFSQTIPLKIGGTPYYPAREGQPFAIKDDGRNPTGSFKDRASAMFTHHALTLGVKVVATASTGNAAAALAGMCAVAKGVQAVVFLPANAPPAKIAQLLVYGAKVLPIAGTYDQAFDLCWEVCERYGWYNRSTGINPFTSEGKKTIAWEIAFSGHPLPDAILVSVGDGSIINGLYKGFSDLKKLGWVERIPRLIGVQAEGSRALVDAWERGLDPREMRPQPAHTLADSISASLPRDRAKALRAVRQSGGAFVAVTDTEILAAIPALAQASGVFAEPAGAAAYAGWCQAVKQGYLAPEENVLILNTGNGLKDIRGAMQAVGAESLTPVAATLEAVEKALAALGLEKR
jgi:threonine synthase